MAAGISKSDPEQGTVGELSTTDKLRATIFAELGRGIRTSAGVFRAIIRAAPLPAAARALDIGCDVLRPTSTLTALADRVRGSVTALEKTPRSVSSHDPPPHVHMHRADAHYWEDAPYDLICVDTGDVRETLSLLTEAVPRYSKPGTIIVARMQMTSSAGQPSLAFFQQNFGVVEPSLTTFLRPLEQTGYEFIAAIPTTFFRLAALLLWLMPRWARRLILQRKTWKPSPWAGRKNRNSWIVLRRQKETSPPFVKSASPAYRALTKEAFALGDFVRWLAKIQREQCPFLRPEAYFAGLQGQIPVSLLKHDIHHDFRRTLLMAEAEAEAGIYGVYFMMHSHFLNETYFNLPFTWSGLRHIQSMGHSIGLHIDILEIVDQSGDLYGEIGEILHQFKDMGIRIEAANSHGNTKYQYTNLLSAHFFKETCGKMVASDRTKLHPFVGAFSLAELQQRFGLRYWLDTMPSDTGVQKRVMYVSDNTGCLALHTPRGAITSEKFAMDAAFKAKAEPEFGRSHTLVLLHPQFYE